MNTRYDVAIIGCGEAGIFAGYELMHRNPGLKVVTLDQGADIYTRSCPIVAGKVKECIHCKVCDTMCGFGGAGAFSDGKYNFTTAFGGWLTDFMPKREVMELIDYVDSINMRHGATDQVFSTETPAAQALEKKALEYDLHLLQARCKHLGTENNLKILQSIYEEVRQGVEFRFRTAVTKIENLGKEGYRLITDKGGRGGLHLAHRRTRPLRRGVVLQPVQGAGHPAHQQPGGHRRGWSCPPRCSSTPPTVYESKLVHRTKQYGDQVRTFCMNPYGHVVAENVEGINTVNGHSYSDPKLRSENTNFALLVSNRFTSPFNEPLPPGVNIASLSNMLAGGVLVQRFGDLVSGIRTNEHRMSKSFVHPTLTAAVPGDLSLALPKRQLDDIIEMIYQLDKLAPGTANYDTLLYGGGQVSPARLALSNELRPPCLASSPWATAGVTRGPRSPGGARLGRHLTPRSPKQISERLK